MASAEIPRCRGCGDPVPSTSVGRRRLAGSAINNLKVSSVWTGLLHEKLDQVSLSVDTEEASSSGYMCKKCFSSFLSLYDVNHKLLDMKHKLLECMDEAIKHINTVTKVPSSLDTAASFGASSVDPGNSSGDAVAGSPSTSLLGKRQADSSELSVAHKRPRIQYNAPPTTSSSPDVQVRIL